MCVTSAVGDFYRDKWSDRPWYPGIFPSAPLQPASPGMPGTIPYVPYSPNPYPLPVGAQPSVPITREEFDRLKAEVEDLKGLLKMAKAYDERNGEPECEVDDKMDLLRRVAKLVGVELDDVIKPAAS